MAITAASATVLRPAGELCEDTIAPFAQALETSSGQVVVDLAEVSLLGAAAMRELVRYRQRGGTVSLRHAAPIVRRALTACGFDELLEDDLSRPRP